MNDWQAVDKAIYLVAGAEVFGKDGDRRPTDAEMETCTNMVRALHEGGMRPCPSEHAVLDGRIVRLVRDGKRVGGNHEVYDVWRLEPTDPAT